MAKLADVKVYACITHGHANVVLADDELKQLIGKKVGAYGRHWVYGDRVNDKITGWCGFKEANILVTYGPDGKDHITFVGRKGLNECIEFLSKFEAK